MASVQDHETRIQTLERKIAFCMKIQQATIGVGHPLDPNRKIAQISMEKLYNEVNYAGGEIIDIPAVPATAPDGVSEVGGAGEGDAAEISGDSHPVLLGSGDETPPPA